MGSTLAMLFDFQLTSTDAHEAASSGPVDAWAADLSDGGGGVSARRLDDLSDVACCIDSFVTSDSVRSGGEAANTSAR